MLGPRHLLEPMWRERGMVEPKSVSLDEAQTRRPSHSVHTPKVRKEIQALRAIAVLLVLVYHFWPGVSRVDTSGSMCSLLSLAF